VIPHVDGHDSEAIKKAIQDAKAITDKPTIICCQTKIGWGAPNLAGTASTHGAALGEKEVGLTRTNLNWPHEPFVVPQEIYASWDARKAGALHENEWQVLFAQYKDKYPDLAMELLRRMEERLPANWQAQVESLLATMQEKKQNVATRKASQLCLDVYANALPELFGGSADLTESNCTNWEGMKVFSADFPEGRYLHYGVREFGMSAIMNGIALYRGMIPFGGTFLTFSDYARNAIRLSALMRARSIFVYTHDSIGLGEDGPTHQPIEQLPGLRMMPQLSLWRPCDTVETAVAWRAAIEHHGPTCLLFSRQAVAFQERTAEQVALISRGGYILCDFAKDKHPDAILIATGSEVGMAMDAAKQLQAAEIFVRVVSMPSTDVFLAQDEHYQQAVLPDAITARIAVEAAASDYWYRFIGLHGSVVGLNRFGASAPAKDVFRDCGMTVDHVVEAVKETIHKVATLTHHFSVKCASGVVSN
jgi:transketolase